MLWTLLCTDSLVHCLPDYVFNCMTMTVELPLDYTVFLLATIAQALVSHLTFAWNTVTLLYAVTFPLAPVSHGLHCGKNRGLNTSTYIISNVKNLIEAKSLDFKEVYCEKVYSGGVYSTNGNLCVVSSELCLAKSQTAAIIISLVVTFLFYNNTKLHRT